MTYHQRRNQQLIENMVIFYFRSRVIASYIIHQPIFTNIECIVLAYITLYGYDKDMIKAAARRADTSEQVIRNNVAKLIKRHQLRRFGKYNVQIVI